MKLNNLAFSMPIYFLRFLFVFIENSDGLYLKAKEQDQAIYLKLLR